jgi:antitoxin MazE
MKNRVQKWGNSLAVRIPKSFAEELGFEDGSPAEMSLEDGAIVIKPDRDKVWDLDALLAGVTDDNLHPAWENEAAAAPRDDPGGESDGNGRDGR